MTDVLDAPTTPLGQPIKRTEDPRFITGKGRYLDDIKLQSMTHMAILRSPYAHANIRSIDTSPAKSMPGVIAVFTGADIPYNPLPMAWPAGGSAGIQNNVSTPRVLATDSVKWTGEGVAAVYDGVGAATFDASLASLRVRGTLALFGAASGPVPPVDLQRLNAAGSVFVTRPNADGNRLQVLARQTF